MKTKRGEKMTGTKFCKLKSRRKSGNLEDLKKSCIPSQQRGKLKKQHILHYRNPQRFRSWKHPVFLELGAQVKLKAKELVNVCLRIGL